MRKENLKKWVKDCFWKKAGSVQYKNGHALNSILHMFQYTKELL